MNPQYQFEDNQVPPSLPEPRGYDTINGQLILQETYSPKKTGNDIQQGQPYLNFFQQMEPRMNMIQPQKGHQQFLSQYTVHPSIKQTDLMESNQLSLPSSDLLTPSKLIEKFECNTIDNPTFISKTNALLSKYEEKYDQRKYEMNKFKSASESYDQELDPYSKMEFNSKLLQIRQDVIKLDDNLNSILSQLQQLQKDKHTLHENFVDDDAPIIESPIFGTDNVKLEGTAILPSFPDGNVSLNDFWTKIKIFIENGNLTSKAAKSVLAIKLNDKAFTIFQQNKTKSIKEIILALHDVYGGIPSKSSYGELIATYRRDPTQNLRSEASKFRHFCEAIYNKPDEKCFMEIKMLEFLKKSASQQALEHLHREERLANRKFTYIECLQKLSDEEEIQKMHHQSNNYYAPQASTSGTNLEPQPTLNYFYQEHQNQDYETESDLEDECEDDFQQPCTNSKFDSNENQAYEDDEYESDNSYHDDDEFENENDDANGHDDHINTRLFKMAGMIECSDESDDNDDDIQQNEYQNLPSTSFHVDEYPSRYSPDGDNDPEEYNDNQDDHEYYM